jgi:phage-related protein
MYTRNPSDDNVPVDEKEEKPDFKIRWLGDSHDRIKAFPMVVRHNLGADLRRVQQGLRPLDSAPMPGLGSGVYELRDEDLGSWYRVIYLKQTKGTVYVLHCFEKKTNQTSRQDVRAAQGRLKEANQEILEKEKNAKRGT